MITIQEALYIHDKAIKEFGGSFGVRDYTMLESTLRRPYATFDHHELYPTVEDKAARILESIIKNHLFVDGNKRVGYILMRYLLLRSYKY